MYSHNLRIKGLIILGLCFVVTIFWEPIKEKLRGKTSFEGIQGNLRVPDSGNALRFFTFYHYNPEKKWGLLNFTCFMEDSKGWDHICTPIKLREVLNISTKVQCLNVSLQALHFFLNGKPGDSTGKFLSALFAENSMFLCCLERKMLLTDDYKSSGKQLCCQIRYFDFTMKISGINSESSPSGTGKCFIWREFSYSTTPINLEAQVQDRAFHKRKLYAQDDEEFERSKPEHFQQPLLGFRVIGCSTVAVFVGLTLIIYVTSGMYYTDCLAQICSEVCVFSAYVCILLITADSKEVKEGLCSTIAKLLHFLFLAFFLFLLFEVVCISRMLLSFFPKRVFSSSRSILLVGWGLPAIICGITAIVAPEQYTGPNNCWLNLEKAPMWPTVIPLGIFIGLHVILLLMVLLVSAVPSSVERQDYKRAESFLTTRWASAIIVVMGTVSWAFGVMASQTTEEMYYGAFTVSSIVLGVVIFILRISTDIEVRKIITSHIVCRFVKQKSQVSPWSEKVFQAEKVLQAEKKAKDSTWRTNEKLTTHS